MPNARIVVFSDLDGVLLSATEASLKAAAKVLEARACENVPLVLCSSQTRAELELVQQKLGIRAPFLCENGSAAFVPSGYFAFDVPGARDRPGYQSVEFGRRYDEIVDTLHRMAARLRIDVLGFSDMSIEAVARDCKVPLLQARLAKLREYEEPFRVVDESPSARVRLLNALHAAGLHCTSVRRFDHVGARVDRGTGVNLLCALYRRAYGAIRTLGLTDPSAAENLLRLVDYPVVVSGDDVASGAVDVVGWAKAIVDSVDDRRRYCSQSFQFST